MDYPDLTTREFVTPSGGFPKIQKAQVTEWLVLGNTSTEPNGKLKINPDGVDDSGDEVVVDNDGNVGIGTSSPAATLDVNGSIYSKSIAGAITSGRLQQPGSGTNTMDFSISFGQTYASPPVVVATLEDGLGWGERPSLQILGGTLTTTSVTVRVYRASGIFGGTRTLHWIAIGDMP